MAIALDCSGQKVTHYIISRQARVGAGKPEQLVVCKVARPKIISNLCMRNYGIYSFHVVLERHERGRHDSYPPSPDSALRFGNDCVDAELGHGTFSCCARNAPASNSRG